MHDVGELGVALAGHGHGLIALNVFLQQIGVPWPAEPTLLVAGSLAARGRLSIVGVIAVALAATLVADLTWYVVGRRYGGAAFRFVLASPRRRRRNRSAPALAASSSGWPASRSRSRSSSLAGMMAGPFRS